MNRFSTEENNYLKENYPKIGGRLCAHRMGRSLTQIQSRARKLKLKFDRRFKLQRNALLRELRREEFLKNSKFKLNEDLSYFLGFCWGDGHYSKNNHMVLQCIEEDLGHVLDILERESVDFTTKVRFHKKWKPSRSIFIWDNNLNYIFEDCDYKNKSQCSCEKILNLIGEKFWPDFFRGLVDADGGWYLNQKEYLRQFSLAGSYKQDWSSIEKLFTSLNIIFNKQRRSVINKKGILNSSSSLRVTDRKSLENLALFIYNGGPCLERKFKKLISILEFNKKPNTELINMFNALYSQA